MSTIAPKFRFSYFLKSITDSAFWALLLLTLIGLPFAMIVLFYLRLPIIDDKLMTPYLALTTLADPSRQIPLIKSIIHSDLFRITAFPGFGFAALLAAGTIFVERKMLAKLQLRVVLSIVVK